MPTTIRQAYGLLTPPRQHEAVWIVLGLIVVAVAETAAMASLLPFLAILGNPDLVAPTQALGRLLAGFGIVEPSEALFALGIFACAMFIGTSILRALVEIRVRILAQMQRHELAMRILRRVLARPYLYFLDRNSKDLIKIVLGDIDRVVHFVLQPTMLLLSQITRFLAVFLLVFVLAPVVTLISAGVLGLFYVAAHRAFRNRMQMSSRKLSEADGERHRLISELLTNYKAMRLTGRETSFLEEFAEPSETVARQYVANQVLISLPRLFVETLAIGSAILAAVILISVNDGPSSNAFGEALPTLGLLAFAALRMLPALQAVFQSVWQIQLGASSVVAVAEELAENTELVEDYAEPLAMKAGLAAENLCFTYPKTEHPIISNLSFRLKAGQSLAILGPTGSGKSTLLDLILGLLEPTGGSISIDGEPLTPERVPSWHAAIAYVPQDGLLNDKTIASNIAYGVSADKIDWTRLASAFDLAQLGGVFSARRAGLETRVGEGGVLLSGGERQRVLIARAFYQRASVLILDEPTSAVDYETERKLIDVIRNLKDTKTVIVVTHRESLAKSCDIVLKLENHDNKNP